jgi:hypothetical protein
MGLYLFRRKEWSTLPEFSQQVTKKLAMEDIHCQLLEIDYLMLLTRIFLALSHKLLPGSGSPLPVLYKYC